MPRSALQFTYAVLTIFLPTVSNAAPLTYEAALRLADQSAPVLRARAADIRAARSAAIAAGRLPDPKLAFGVEGFAVSGPLAGHPSRDDFTDARLGVMQDIPSLAKRRSERERAAADIAAEEINARAQTREVRLGAALAWIDLYYAERRLAALAEIDAALAPLRDTAPAALASGALRPAQTVEPEQLTAALGDRRADLIAAVAKARAELVRWTGDLQPQVSGGPPDYGVDPIVLRAAVDSLPMLAVYEAKSRQADADVDLAKAGKHPDWSWELAYQHRDPRFGDMVAIQGVVSLPIFASTRQDPIISARVATAGRVRIEREMARRDVMASLESSLADHVMHHDRLARARQTLLPLAQRRARLEAASYAGGSASLSDILGALLGLAEARIDLLDREAAEVSDAVRIAITYGSDPQ